MAVDDPTGMQGAAPQGSSATRESEQGLRILLVDDKRFARKVMEQALLSLGLEDISHAEGGKDAVTQIAQADPPFDVVICDLIMPDMDGIQVVRDVADLDQHPAFIFASGAQEKVLAATEELATARGLTVLGTVEKPVGRKQLQTLLNSFAKGPTQFTRRAPPTLNVKEIVKGLESDALCLFFQPKINIQTKAVDGMEALARWRHPEHGILSPASFIDTIENNGLMPKLTDRVIELALRQSAQWRERGLDLRMSINVSARDLDDLTLPDQISQRIADHGAPPQSVVIEVTESGVFQDVATSLDVLTRLHMKGIVLSIDDFGTGYSSMEQLERIPFSELKIDRAFVTNARGRPKAMAILQTSVDLAKRMSLHTIAEGAETQDDWDLLAEAGVDLVQGYFVAKPMPPDRVPDWVKDWTAAQTAAD